MIDCYYRKHFMILNNEKNTNEQFQYCVSVCLYY